MPDIIEVVALICALSVAPADCNKDSAAQVVALRSAPNELACMFSGQATMAGLAIKPHAGEYLKVQCIRMHPDA